MKAKTSILILFLTQISIAQVPDWYTSHTAVKYPVNDFIIGVGSASGEKGIEMAKKAALADIVSQMRVQVQSEMKTVNQSFQMNSDEQIYSDFKEQTHTVVTDEITGAEIAETAVDQATQTAYALAVLNRDTYCQSVGSELTSGWKQASDLRSTAKDYLAKGRLVEAIQSVQQVRQVIAPLVAKQVLYNAVAKSPFQSDFTFYPDVLQQDIRSFLSEVRIEKAGGDKQQGKIGNNFPQSLLVAVSLMNGTQTVPCVGVSVEFVYDERNSLGQGITDANGYAAINAAIRPMSGDGIRARLLVPGLGREFDKNITASSVNFTWTALPSDKKFTLTINAKSPKIATVMQSKFSTAITKAGYGVVPVADYALTIDVQYGAPGKVTGFSGTVFTVTLNVTATLTETKSNTMRGSTIFTAQGVGTSESEAVEKAAANLQLGEKEFGDLLQK